MKHIFFIFLLGTLTHHATAQNYSIKWFKIANGGGTSTNAEYTVSGIMGQPDVGTRMSDGTYSLGGGFWNLFTTVPTVGAPLLSLEVTATNTVMISWPSPSPGFNLEVTSDLATPEWEPAIERVQDGGTIRFVLINPVPGNHFYRLKQP